MERRMIEWSQNKIVKLLTVFFIGLFSTAGFSQNYDNGKMSKDAKKINKCWRVFNTKSHTKGIEKLEKYMKKQQWPSLLAYESLVAMEYAYYKRNSSAFKIEVEEPDGESGTDSLMLAFQDMMSGFYLGRFVNVCRMSTLESTSPSADMYLRQMLVDNDPDTMVSEKGLSYYSEAEEFFIKNDFELAELNYRKALAQDEGYYKANLYLGDTFWARNVYDSALVYYNIAKDLQPELLEPRIYIIDALVEEGLFYRAKKECIEAFTIYPGYNLKFKLQRILSIENKVFNERRIMRNFYPNEIGNDEQLPMDHDPYWIDYRKAKSDVSKYCNENGIIEENGETEDRYLEVYSLRKMLKKHSGNLPESLQFADEMRKEGLLEPYVFVSLFHIDIYPQFKHYMEIEENREKTIEFIERYLIDLVR